MSQPEAAIGYILKGYPRTSETFVSNEIFLLERQGIEISIFSLKKLEGQKLHGVSTRIRAAVTQVPEPSAYDNGPVIGWVAGNIGLFSKTHLDLLRRLPFRYLAGLAMVLWLSVAYRDGAWRPALRSYLKEFLQAGFIADEALKSGRIRHLHAHFCHTSTTVAMLAARLSGLPFSFTAHAKDIYKAGMNPGRLLTLKLREASFAITCTAANLDYLARLGDSSKLHCIYHGIDLSLFAPDGTRKAGGVPHILAAGRFVEKKGFTYLIEACGLLKNAGVKFNCTIVGGAGDHSDAVGEAVARLDVGDVVKLHAAVAQEDLKAIYRSASIFVLPCIVTDDGDRDGIPNVIVEAMAMGLPVITTGVSGIPELVVQGETGLIVKQRDPAALAGAIRRLIENPELAASLARAGSEAAHRDFDAGRNILALHRLFKAALEDGGLKRKR